MEDDDPHLGYLCTFIFIIFLLIAPSQGTIIPTDVHVTNEYVSANGYCSCGHGSYSYTGEYAFLNYCPYCKRFGTLYLERDPVDSPEGMWVCSVCDNDYCIQRGKNHSPRELWLIPYKPPALQTAKSLTGHNVQDVYLHSNISSALLTLPGVLNPSPNVLLPSPNLVHI